MKWIFMSILLFRLFFGYSQEYYFRQMPFEFGDDIQHINHLFQANDQLMWIGTDRGFYSFDGLKYRFAQRPDKQFVPVTSISESITDHSIWAGYEDGYIQVISPQGNITSIQSDSIAGIPVSKILFHRDNIFIATYGAGLWQLKNGQLERLRHDDLAVINDIYDALIDQEGRVWMGTDNGIWIYKAGQKLFNYNQHNGLPDEIVTHLETGSNGDIWLGFYDHGLGRYQLGRDTIMTAMSIDPTDGSMIALSHGHEDEVWFCTGKKVFRYSVDEGEMQIHFPAEITERIEALHYDRTGNLWIAAGNRLYMANTQFRQLIPGVNGIQAVTPGDHVIWLGCQNGLYNYDQSTRKLESHLPGEQLNVLSIYKDPHGILWIGTFGQGLYIYDPDRQRWKQLTENEKISNNSVLNIDGRGSHVWLATLGGITEIFTARNPFDDDLQITLFREKYNFPPGYVYDVYCAKDDKVWFGTDGKGLFCLDKNELKQISKPVQYLGQDSFDLRTIYSITGDDENNIWVSGTKGNILKMDERGNLTDHIQSPYGSLSSLVTSGQNEIVIVREGLVQINNPSNGVFSFGPSTGLNSFSPNINATARDHDGTVWIGDTDKVIHYNPIPSDTSRYVHMHMMDMTPGMLRRSDHIRLPHDSNFLDFKFTGLWYQDPSVVKYRYMLKGHDQDWIYTQEGRAVYSKLSPGTYTFIVAGSHNGDFSNSIPIQRQIVVMPPIYLRWWFILGVAALISFLTFRYLRDRLNRINAMHQLEKEKTTLQLHAIQAQVNPHFLFNSFNTLSGIIEENQEAAVNYVDQLSSFFRGVLLHRDAELITLKEEIEIMRNYTYILQKRYGDNIRIKENISSLEGFIAPLSLQLLVENAIKHNRVTNERPLTIDISIADHWLTVSNPIQPKFQSETESTGFGLSSLLTRYQYLTPQKIEIINDGKTFTVKLPIIKLKPSK